MRVVFWGTPEFAAPPLRALLGEGFDVAAVVTQPDKPVGRSRSKVEAPPVKQIAIEEGLRVLQPEKAKGDEAFAAQLREIAPDISIVVAYGQLLSKELIELPRRGTLNIHASLLPAFRGAAPIQAAILAGLTETGVTIMRMVPKLDAGPIVHQHRTPIAEDETGGELALRLSELGALALVEALAMIEVGAAPERPQDEAAATYAPKIDRDATRIDWTKPATEVARRIRAFDPRPGAFATHREADLKVFGGRAMASMGTAEPGEITLIDANGMAVACGDGSVQITSVQPAGKRRLAPNELSNGRGIAVGERLF
ncbi:MAG TPA: methionyl-tRNA formyltransferase [Gemmatimonadaceae bacterium]|nr:methionyl-tRNA formyltransferase [Gemmatimonadaceae bacterium]